MDHVILSKKTIKLNINIDLVIRNIISTQSYCDLQLTEQQKNSLAFLFMAAQLYNQLSYTINAEPISINSISYLGNQLAGGSDRGHIKVKGRLSSVSMGQSVNFEGKQKQLLTSMHLKKKKIKFPR